MDDDHNNWQVFFFIDFEPFVCKWVSLKWCFHSFDFDRVINHQRTFWVFKPINTFCYCILFGNTGHIPNREDRSLTWTHLRSLRIFVPLFIYYRQYVFNHILCLIWFDSIWSWDDQYIHYVSAWRQQHLRNYVDCLHQIDYRKCHQQMRDNKSLHAIFSKVNT